MCLNMVRKICAKVRKICEIGEMLSCVNTYILSKWKGGPMPGDRDIACIVDNSRKYNTVSQIRIYKRKDT